MTHKASFTIRAMILQDKHVELIFNKIKLLSLVEKQANPVAERDGEQICCINNQLAPNIGTCA